MQRLSLEARRLTFAQHAVAGLVDESGSKASHVFTSGFSDRVAGSLKPPSLKGTVIVEVLAERRPVRVRRPLVGPELLRVPGDDLPVQSLLSVPVASPTKVFGWLSLRNKLGAEEFTDVDERVALTLATYTAVAYENAQELDELTRRLLQREEQLVHATARVRHVREEERAQLSRQLHDQLGQSLAGLKLGLQQVVSLLPPTTDTTDLGARVNTMIQAVDTSIASVRDLANELRPTVLDRLGLVAALEWQTETFERRCGIPCRVATSIDRVALDAGRSTSIFRIVEEALTNILQHAHATHVAVTVRKAAGRLKIAIVDDGTGISEREMSDGRSLGLIGMRERAALLGGTLDIQKRRAGGTSVALDVPLGERRRHSRGHDD
jgi:signal transduction histidine kinase